MPYTLSNHGFEHYLLDCSFLDLWDRTIFTDFFSNSNFSDSLVCITFKLEPCVQILPRVSPNGVQSFIFFSLIFQPSVTTNPCYIKIHAQLQYCHINRTQGRVPYFSSRVVSTGLNLQSSGQQETLDHHARPSIY